MPATQTHVEQYREEGYVLIPNLIPRDLMQAAGERAEDVCLHDRGFNTERFHYVDPARYTRDDGSPLPLGIQRPALEEDVFRRVAEHPNLVSAMAELLGGDVELFTDQIAVKHGFINEAQGARTYYHQDSFYWHIDPRLGCNCWIPMQDVDRDAIALAVIPRSHEGWTLAEHESYYDDPPLRRGGQNVNFKRHRVPLDQVDDSNEVFLPMKAGDGLFFTNYTWHRSDPNRTGRTLSYYAIAYQLANKGLEIDG